MQRRLTGEVSNVCAAGGDTGGASGSELVGLVALAGNVVLLAADLLGGLFDAGLGALGHRGDELLDALGGDGAGEEGEGESLELHVGGSGGEESGRACKVKRRIVVYKA